MKIPKDIAERVINDDMQDLWGLFVTLEGEYEEYNDEYKKIKYGYKVKFPIYWLWKDTNKILCKPKNNTIIIDNVEYNEDEFETEKEIRRKIMVEAVLENTDELNLIEPR